MLFYFLWPAHSAMGVSRNLFHKDWFHNAIGGPYKYYSGYKDHFLHALLVPNFDPKLGSDRVRHGPTEERWISFDLVRTWRNPT